MPLDWLTNTCDNYVMSDSVQTSPMVFSTSLKRPLLLALVAGLLTAVAVMFLPNYYRSEARILPVDAKGVGGNMGGLASAAAAFGVSLPGGDTTDANFVDVLNSRWLREELLKTEFEYHVRSFPLGAIRLERKTLLAYLEVQNMDRAIASLGSVLTSSRDLKSKVISIGAETTSPELSQMIVQKTSKLLETFNREKGRTRGGAKASFAESRLLEARKELNEVEGTFRRFLETNRNYQTSGDPAVRLQGARLDAELRLRQQLVTAIAMNREQALLEEKNDVPILNMLDQGNLPIEKSKPSRSIMVLQVILLTVVGSWIWINRDWVKDRILAGSDEQE